ncbi:carboxypeptidase-like regulatory domain-containing protein [Polaribacter sp. PL03]|uniref:carboxypeptidase-like regulatory domain-containing protein n=1 Tax=Polaribacter sp. PL03 TaxID=3088353 RepID=UPI0029CEC23D|nr:carboxypeptidase-like regulatory domain-containing protein [Polaribacter sp. PL03]MDX6745303.1 carboxypeptidase-like regulatory domain-containing protein [Polaribacter sp. PL03]
MGEINNKELKFLIILLFFQNLCFSQTKISGIVKDAKKNLFSASVLLKDSINNIVDYTYASEKGIYQFSTIKKGKFNITFSSLGYKTKTVSFEITTQKNIKIDAILKEKPFELDEIIIEAEKEIKIKKDTITFKTKFFVNGTEQTVEDLLKKIPGLNIDSQGTIKVGNQEIEKLMIDGDDLFEKGYKILSKNMPAYPIEEVEVLKKYSNNRLLKGVEESNKVALNLKMNEKAKRIWFGNTTIGLGNDNFYELKGNLMNFGKKNKYYFLTNLNNIGYNATGDIQSLIRPFRTNEAGVIGDNMQVGNLLNLSAGSLNFKRSRTNFNNAELLSLNAIFNPTEKVKIKTLGFFNWDETDFFRNSTEVFNANNTNFTNTEDFTLRNKKIIGFGKVDVIYNISKTKMLESTTKYNSGNYNANSNLIFNGKSTLENLESNNTLFDQKINYTNKFKDKKVFLLSGRFIKEETPQNYSLNRFLYQDLFPNATNADNVQQLSTNKMTFAGINVHLLDRKENDNLVELKLGNEFRKDNLKTVFSLLEDKTVLNKPTDYQNNTSYLVNNSYLKTKYRYKIKDFALVGKLDFHQLYNRFTDKTITKEDTPFYINPSIGFDWKINDKNKLMTSYSYNYRNASILDVYDNFVLTGFRSFTKGTGNFNQLNSSNFIFNYQLGNWSERFFANTFLIYNKNHNFFSTNSIITQNYAQTEKILIKDNSFLSINTNLDYYFNFISSNLKLELGYSENNFKNIINNSNLREIKSKTYNYGFEMRSGFSGIFNYHFGSKWNTNTIKTTIENSFTDNTSFLDLSFVFSEKFDFQVQTERYFFGNLENDNTYYFLDAESRYEILKDKLTLSISGKNLFNTKKFRNFSISDFGSSSTEYRLLPRSILLKMEYRF